MQPEASLCGTAMVTKAGSVLGDVAGGMSDIKLGVPCTSRSRFQVASVSKQFAAATVLLLVESGCLDLDEPVDRWLPAAPTEWRSVTLDHLLSHTGGVPHWREAPGLDPAEPMSSERRLASILAAPLRSEPGRTWHYSSPGYLLAAHVAERASGRPYRELVTDLVLSPLQLTETVVMATPSDAARGYRAGEPVVPFALGAMAGTGDIWSTTSDLTRFTSALHHGELISRESLRAMCATHVELSDEDEDGLVTTGYGFGMYIGLVDGHPALYHPGDNPGYLSMACWLPDQDASVVILLNDEASDMPGLLRELLATALGA